MPDEAFDAIFENLRREFDSSRNRAAELARADALRSVNQLLRRFRSYQNEAEWIQTTMDAAVPYASQLALFFVVRENVELRAQHPAGSLPQTLSIPLAAASAFRSLIDSKDTVTVLRTPGEVSDALSQGHDRERAHLFPITNVDRVSAILFASGESANADALELMAGLASSVLERKTNAAIHTTIAAQPAAPLPEAKPAPAKLPAWSDLPAEQRQLHIRAQRFARVAVAEIQMSKPEACRAGREQSDLYLFLKREIDKARESFRQQFMTDLSMVDYLHLELIKTAAEGDELKLGADYPGRLQ